MSGLGSRGMLPALFMACVILMSLAAGISSAQDTNNPGIGVDNDGPSFISTSITETDTNKYVNVQVRDLNGWDDIFSINVTVLDGRGNPICSVSYMQYPNLVSTSVAAIIWNETAGGFFDEAGSSWNIIPVLPWNTGNTTNIGLSVNFAFEKFSGDRIQILVLDRGLLTCATDGPFSAEYTPAPEWENVAIPISLSSVVAVFAAGFLVYRRFKNNKVARAVEASQAASGEE